jgi:hypothetical protein
MCHYRFVSISTMTLIDRVLVGLTLGTVIIPVHYALANIPSF